MCVLVINWFDNRVENRGFQPSVPLKNNGNRSDVEEQQTTQIQILPFPTAQGPIIWNMWGSLHCVAVTSDGADEDWKRRTSSSRAKTRGTFSTARTVNGDKTVYHLVCAYVSKRYRYGIVWQEWMLPGVRGWIPFMDGIEPGSVVKSRGISTGTKWWMVQICCPKDFEVIFLTRRTFWCQRKYCFEN